MNETDMKQSPRKKKKKLPQDIVLKNVIYRFLNKNVLIIDVPIFILLLWEGRKPFRKYLNFFLKFANSNTEIHTKITLLTRRISLESLAMQLKTVKRH